MPNTRFATADLLTLFSLRVLVRHDTKYDVHVAHCIETGGVVTGTSPTEVSEMMKELLEDEISFALRNRNLKNLFSSPAPMEVLFQWMKAAKEKPPVQVDLDVDFYELEPYKIEPKDAHFTNQVRFALAA
jgi:hypothetical protein